MESLDFMHVWQVKKNERRINIFFKVDHRLYLMEVSKAKGMFFPMTVLHETTIGNCPFCLEKAMYACPFLVQHQYELFLQLIESPKLRLEWLFLPHV